MFDILQYGTFKANVFKTDPTIVTTAVAQLVGTFASQAEGWVFESQPKQI